MRASRLFALLLYLCAFTHSGMAQAVHSVNALLGDNSWLAAYGRAPHARDAEEDRIRTHLNFVLNKLQQRALLLSDDLSLKRQELLCELEAYIAMGAFPRQHKDAESRLPCFVDDEGRLCAVAHLIHATGDDSLVAKINARYRYSLLEDMHDEELLTWQKQSGLKLTELAMIQPSYAFERPMVVAHPNMVYRDSISGLYGVKKRKNGRILTKAKYTAISLYMNHRGYGIAKIDGPWAIVDERGKAKTPFEFDEVQAGADEDFSIFIVKKDSVYFLLNEKGKRIGSKVYDEMWQDNYNFLRVRNGLNWGIMKMNGQFLLPVVYEQISSISPQYFIVNANGKAGLRNDKNEEIIPMEYRQIQGVKVGWKAVRNNLIDLYTVDGVKGSITDLTGLYPYGNTFHDAFMMGKKHGKYGLINRDLQWMIPPIHDTLIRYLEYHRAEKDGKWGMYNNARQLILPMKYSHITYTLSSFVVRENAEHGNMGILDLHGEAILPVEQDSVYRLARNQSGGLSYCYAVLNNGLWEIVNQSGEKINEKPISEIRSLGSDLLCIRDGEDYFVGYFQNEKLHLYRDHPFQEIQRISGWDGTSVFKRAGKFGLIRLYSHQSNTPGRILTEAVYDSLFKAPLSYLYIFKENGRYGVMDSEGRVSLAAEFESVYHDQVKIGPGYPSYMLLYKTGEKVLVDSTGKRINPEQARYIIRAVGL